MKYLLSWIAKHFESPLAFEKAAEKEDIIKKIGSHITEVASHKRIEYIKKDIALGVVVENSEDFSLVQYNATDKVISLAPRKDAEIGSIFLIVKDKNNFRFATSFDLFSEVKNVLLPALSGSIEDNVKKIDTLKKSSDLVIKVDTTSIGNRQDLFSHRGMARELSVLFNLSLKKEDDLIKGTESLFSSNKKEKLVAVNTNDVSSVFSVALQCEEESSFFDYLVPLCAVDVSPRSFLVDLTNYVMFDVGQPLHVFDKKKIEGSLTIKKDEEKTFPLLDGSSITSLPSDILIMDNENPVSLAGIIGGSLTGVTFKSNSILLQAESFNPKCIMFSARKHKKKTNSALRNERGSSPESVRFGIYRFLFFLSLHLKFAVKGYFHYVQKDSLYPKKIRLKKEYITSVIGCDISDERIKNIFIGLGLDTVDEKDSFSIRVPYYRYDVSNKDDLVEEVVRHIGFDNIPLFSPKIVYNSYAKKNIISELKSLLVILSRAREVVSYGIINECALARWGKPNNRTAVALSNPYSEYQKNLSFSALPSLLDTTCHEIKGGKKEVRVFEVSPLWSKKEDGIDEMIYLSCCFYNAAGCYNFYEYRDCIEEIFEALKYPLSFRLASGIPQEGLFSSIVSDVFYNEKKVGSLGFVNPLRVFDETKQKGEVFAVEVNLTKLFSESPLECSLARDYSFFDISFLLSLSDKVEHYVHQLKEAFGQIVSIEVIDWFEAPDWKEHRSVTLRVYHINKKCNGVEEEVRAYLVAREIRVR